MPNRNQRPQNARRNFVAKNQWQRGGVHEKTNKAKRQKNKQHLKRKIRINQFDADFLFAHYFPNLMVRCFFEL